MKGNMYQPRHAVRHSLPCIAVLALQLHEAHLLQTARIIRSTICKHNRSIENQSFSAPFFWRYPIIVAYKRLAYIRGMLFSLSLNYNKLNCYGV
jgi:hypothetical protein